MINAKIDNGSNFQSVLDMISSLHDNLNSDLQMLGPNICIYGSGSTGKLISSILLQHGIKPLCFIDSQPKNSDCNNIPVIKIDDFQKFGHEKYKVTVVIGVFNPDEDSDNRIIYSFLTNRGFTSVITILEFYSYLDSTHSRYWVTNANYYKKFASELYEIYNLLEDYKSKSVFCETIKARILYKMNNLPDPDKAEIQYFIDPVLNNTVFDVFIDCGSFNGDTIIQLNKLCGQVSQIFAFEPDLKNFHDLSENLNSKLLADEIFTWPCGLWSESLQLHFSSGNNDASTISSDGNQFIQCISLDDAIKLKNRNIYLKMDIEGSELETLLGARKLFDNNSVSCAISLYHKPEDIIQIPKILKSFNEKYKFYIRQHAYNGFELVLYALLV